MTFRPLLSTIFLFLVIHIFLMIIYLVLWCQVDLGLHLHYFVIISSRWKFCCKSHVLRGLSCLDFGTLDFLIIYGIISSSCCRLMLAFDF